MQSLFRISIIGSILLVASWGFLSYGTGRGYQTYLENWEYRRLHPELIASPEIIRLFAMGHTTAYASWEWLSLIQYIGDNISDNRFLDFSHRMLSQITTLHPYFTRPYEMDLIFAPLSLGENMTPEAITKNKAHIADALSLGKRGISRLCDASKIESIKSREIAPALWDDTSLQDPCASDMLPYYMGFTTYQASDDRSQASLYYKIASMNTRAPKASRILSILALSSDGDYMASALNFALIGSTGYDTDPYICRGLATRIIGDIIDKKIIDSTWIALLNQAEKNLKNTTDPKNPLSSSSDNCYDMTTRSIKSIYLSYIAALAEGTPAKNGDDLISLGKLDSIPTISTQSGYTVRQRKGIWEYQSHAITK